MSTNGKSPFEIRLSLLKLAQNIARNSVHGYEDGNGNTSEYRLSDGTIIKGPSTDDIITIAQKLNSFVSKDVDIAQSKFTVMDAPTRLSPDDVDLNYEDIETGASHRRMEEIRTENETEKLLTRWSLRFDPSLKPFSAEVLDGRFKHWEWGFGYDDSISLHCWAQIQNGYYANWPAEAYSMTAEVLEKYIEILEYTLFMLRKSMQLSSECLDKKCEAAEAMEIVLQQLKSFAENA